MKKGLQIVLLAALGLGIAYQVYIYAAPKATNKPTIPEISLRLLDESSTSVARVGDGKHTIVFLVRSNCDFCKKEIQQVRKNIDHFKDTELIFISFEDLDVIERFQREHFPDKRSFITFAMASQEEVEQFLEQDLVYPYMLWFDNEGIQKAQHMGLFPISRIIEVIDQSS